MSKLGTPYQNIVAMVAQAMHPNALVEEGKWIETPDTEREVDVCVHGIIEGTEKFVLIECKDWKRNIGIQAIDELDSKRVDLKADITILASNRGFSASALRKARRKGIVCVSALVAGNDVIRFVVEREFVAKGLSVEQYSCTVYGPAEQDLTGLDVNELTFEEKQLSVWLQETSKRLLVQHEFATKLSYRCCFDGLLEFQWKGTTVQLHTIDIHMRCKRRWHAQMVQEEASQGFFDHIAGAVVVPDQEAWSIKFDQTKWRELMADEVEELGLDKATSENILPASALAEGTINMAITLLNPAFREATGPIPPLTEHVDDEEVVIGSALEE